ncbi:FAD-dependent oxidoreductase [Prosthecodimorpha staleyi]|uniref:FAD-dependent oxidoreductase n=1 Tax=Prosthecodimorpha staleyi TaxID=2840188 RepID=A0A947D0Q4_9HYPH|nr:FAD-dependent oxidoreductase [Prosthecodimorpha staleyi]MBT9288625.1 FAD-dependent oxidoreductase [Prosthecodimorpha staleyi]
MTDVRPDPKSVAGKAVPPAETTDLLVIGAGPAGLAAAIEAAQAGIGVILVDEHPVGLEVMGDEVPLHFGQAMTGAVRNRNAMMEAVLAATPEIEAAVEAGVDVRLGTAAWGLYANGPGLAWLPGTLVGVAADGAAHLIGARKVIVAAGRRDMGLAFPGWELPGVVGATAALTLARRYQALAPRRVVWLGSTSEALVAALDLRAAGVEIAAVVDCAAAPVGAPDLVAALAAGGTEILAGHAVRRAEGSDRVASVTVVPVDATGADAGPARTIACDGAVLAVAAVPVVDLLDAAGCRIGFDPARGGHVPVVDADQRTSIADIHAVGDCAGVWPAKARDPEIARAEGRRAARAAVAGLGGMATGLGATAAGLGTTVAPVAHASGPEAPETDPSAYRIAWVAANVVHAVRDCTVCQCEEVTAREILEVRPPRYLEAAADARNDRSLAALLGDGPPDPDQVKRLTRAGMGPCQGRRCREQVAALLAIGGAVPLDRIRLANHRAPVRPLSLAVLGSLPEHPDQAAHWDSWFGMKGQWRPFWEVPPQFRVGDDAAGPQVSE